MSKWKRGIQVQIEKGNNSPELKGGIKIQKECEKVHVM